MEALEDADRTQPTEYWSEHREILSVYAEQRQRFRELEEELKRQDTITEDQQPE